MIMVRTADKKKKIGLLGGTFDPVHNGHLAVAGFAQQTLGLDSVLFIPAALPPHKTRHADGLHITSFTHRFKMLEQAIESCSAFEVSDIEAHRARPSYSIDTLHILIPQVGKQAELFFIIGLDAFFEIHTWKRFAELPSLVNFLLISRPGFPPDKVEEVISHNFPGYCFDPKHETWSSRHSKGSFILKHMDPVPISSTQVREKVRAGKDITGIVPRAVADYIRSEGLYR